MNPCDTIQASILLELEKLKKENAELQAEQKKLRAAFNFLMTRPGSDPKA